MQNEKGHGVFHATESQVPQKLEEKAPLKLEHKFLD
jgi:hypothetical protein